MAEPVSIFEILGPIMIGPSSSHTAGASRIGAIARQLLAEKPVKAVITLYNSFAKTHRGHGTDRAIIGGILGFAPDDVRIRQSPEIATREGLTWEFKFQGDATRFHSNTARVHLEGRSGASVELVGVSLGGKNRSRNSIYSAMRFSISRGAQKQARRRVSRLRRCFRRGAGSTKRRLQESLYFGGRRRLLSKRLNNSRRRPH